MSAIDESWYKKPEDKSFPAQELAGGIVVRRNEGRLLVAFVGDKKFSDYILPKGRIEKGESEVAAAKREIAEEAGLDKLQLIEKLGIKERFTFDKTKWNTYHYFLFTTDQIKGVQRLGPDEKDYFVKWFDINNLPPIFWPEQKALIEENKDKIMKLLHVTS